MLYITSEVKELADLPEIQVRLAHKSLGHQAVDAVDVYSLSQAVPEALDF